MSTPQAAYCSDKIKAPDSELWNVLFDRQEVRTQCWYKLYKRYGQLKKVKEHLEIKYRVQPINSRLVKFIDHQIYIKNTDSLLCFSQHNTLIFKLLLWFKRNTTFNFRTPVKVTIYLLKYNFAHGFEVSVGKPLILALNPLPIYWPTADWRTQSRSEFFLALALSLVGLEKTEREKCTCVKEHCSAVVQNTWELRFWTLLKRQQQKNRKLSKNSRPLLCSLKLRLLSKT